MKFARNCPPVSFPDNNLPVYPDLLLSIAEVFSRSGKL
jgi:hypothetical protein